MIENFNANTNVDTKVLNRKLSQETIDLLMDKKLAVNMMDKKDEMNLIQKKKEGAGKCDVDSKCVDFSAPIYPEEKNFNKIKEGAVKDGGSKFGQKDGEILDGGDKDFDSGRRSDSDQNDLTKPEGSSDGGPKKPEEPGDGGVKDPEQEPEGDSVVQDPGFQDLRYDIPEDEVEQPRELEA